LPCSDALVLVDDVWVAAVRQQVNNPLLVEREVTEYVVHPYRV